MTDVRSFGSDIVSQAEVEGELNRLLGLMGERTEELAVLSMRASAAEVEFKKAFAIAYTKGNGPVKEREAEATLASLDAYAAYKRETSLEKSAQEALRSIGRALDVLRTIASNIRSVT